MSGNRLVWDGLAELRAELRKLPAELAAEASGIVLNAAEGARDEIVAAYPERTGNLRSRVSVSKGTGGQYGQAVIVKNTAKHAWMFENGTQARHTDLGANRGAMPAGHVFIPAVIRHRARMYDRLRDLMMRHGLYVSGAS